MAEVMVKDGTWAFDGETIRIVPSRDRGVHKLRQSLGELTVPLAAVAGVAYEPGRKGGSLRLRLREGADPFTQATSGRLPDAADPYRLTVDPDRTGAAEYFADEVRSSLELDRIPREPSDRYLMPGPSVPLTGNGGDGVATFDGSAIRLVWNWMAEQVKRDAGPQEIAVKDLARIDWVPSAGLENGHVRFRTRHAAAELAPKHDPHCVMLWGFDKEIRTMAPLIAAVVARMPHPAAPAEPAALPAAPEGADPDVLLRRLRELGELRRDGVLTDEEFAAAKQALLKRL